MKKHIWTTLAIWLGILSFASGTTQSIGGNIIAGGVILLSAFACRSANKRRLLEVRSNSIRIGVEFALMLILFSLIVMQNNLILLVTADPVPNVIIPLICIYFYEQAYFKARRVLLSI